MSELRIVRGNSFLTRIKVRPLNPDGSVMDDFSLLDCTDLSLFAVRAWKAVRINTWEIHSDDEIDVTWNAPYCMTIGIYGLEIMGRLDGAAWRFCNRDLFDVVETSAEANIPDGAFIADGSYEMTADFQLVLRVGAVQSDWSVTEATNPAFILNKPGYRGEFRSVQSLTDGVTDPKLDDYALIKAPTGLGGNIGAYFYRYDGTSWSQAFMVESTMLSDAEWAALYSGVTATKVAKLDALPTNAELTNALAAKQDVISDLAAIRSGAEAGATAYQKPAAGIPETDLSTGVRASLEKAEDAAEVFVYEVDASNLVDGRKEVEDTTVYPLLSSHEAAGDVVLVRLTNNASYPFVLPVIQRTDTTILFAATMNGARLFTGYVEVYPEGYLIYCAADSYYTKPTGGIPASDLAQAVRTSLQKADTALQSESDPVFTASPAHSITASDIAAWDAKADKVPVVNHGTSSTTLAIAPNTFHIWGTVSALNITLTAPTDTSVYNEYMFQFTSGSTATTLTLPSGIQWMYETPTIDADKTYQVSIVNNVAVIGGTE